MKVTKQYLKQVIKEELQKVLEGENLEEGMFGKFAGITALIGSLVAAGYMNQHKAEQLEDDKATLMKIYQAADEMDEESPEAAAALRRAAGMAQVRGDGDYLKHLAKDYVKK